MQFGRAGRASPTRGSFRAVLVGIALTLWLGSLGPFVPVVAMEAAHAGGFVASGADTSPQLSFPSDPVRVVAGQTHLPILLQTGGHDLAAVAFSLDLDPQCLTVDGGDAGQDGTPDALADLPPGFTVSFLVDPTDTDGEVDIALYDVSLPSARLADGTLLTLRLGVTEQCPRNDAGEIPAPLAFASSPAVVFGSTGGTRVVGTAAQSQVRLQPRHAPTGINLSTSQLAEHLPPGAPVGKLSAADVDTVEAHTFRLVAAPETDAAAFVLLGDTLLTATTFDYERRADYCVAVEATDSDGLSVRQTLVIAVTNVNEPPQAADDLIAPAAHIFVGAGGPIDVLANDTDPDRDTRLAVTAVERPPQGEASIAGRAVLYDPPDDASGEVTFGYTIADDGAPPLTDRALITLTFVANDPRGDCNADHAVDAGDLAALAQELLDESIQVPWYRIHAEGYPGSPQGCDADADRLLTAGDLACTARLAFGYTCADAVAAMSVGAPPTLELHVTHGETGPVAAVRLADPADTVTALVFALAYDPALLVFDPADDDGDGTFDAVQWALPPQARAWAFAGEGVLQVALVMAASPATALPDGGLLAVHFDRLGPAETGLALQRVSAGSTAGAAVTVSAPDDVRLPTYQHWFPWARGG